MKFQSDSQATSTSTGELQNVEEVGQQQASEAQPSTESQGGQSLTTIEVSSTAQQQLEQCVSTSMAVSMNQSNQQALPSTSLSSPVTSAHNTNQQLIAVSQNTSSPLMAVTNAVSNGQCATSGHCVSTTPTAAVQIQQAAALHQQPILHTSVQPTAIQPTAIQQTATNMNAPMSVSVSSLPQVQVIGQQLAQAGTYQLQPVYQAGQMALLPNNLTLQNIQSFGQNTGLSLQIPYSSTNALVGGPMPITSMAGKPIMSKGVAISQLPNLAVGAPQMISPLKQNIANSPQILKSLAPGQQFLSSNNQTVLLNQFPVMQQPAQQTILPATHRTIDASKGKQFATGSFRSPFGGNKMLSHAGTIQPKSPILPASPAISSHQLIHGQQFKTHFTGANTTQLIATQAPGLISNQQQILSSFSPQIFGTGAWVTASPQSTLVAQNAPPIFIRTPAQQGEQHMFIQTSTPQIQTMSMGTPMNVATSGTTVQVAQANAVVSTISQPVHHTATTSATTATSVTTTSVTASVQPAPIAPSPNVPSSTRTRLLRPANSISSVATQTAASTISSQKHHPEASSTPKGPPQNKSKSNQSSKLISNVQTTTPHNVAKNSVASLTNQTNLQQANGAPVKSDAGNQTSKISVGTETEAMKKVNRANEMTKTLNKNNVAEVSSQQKLRSEEMKPSKRNVEKKDASTEQDKEMLAIYNAQLQQQKHLPGSLAVTNNIPAQNGQPVLTEANRHEVAKQPQKAIVKPQILTHVIDGYVIQESPDPFPVNGLSFSVDSQLNVDASKNDIANSHQRLSKNKNENISTSVPKLRSETSPCDNCGKRKMKNKNKKGKSKRFCSALCSEKFKEKSLPNSVTAQIHAAPISGAHLQREADAAVESKLLDDRKKQKVAKKLIADGTEHSPDLECPPPVVEENGECSSAASESVARGGEDPNNPLLGLYLPPGGRNPLNWNVHDVYEFVRNLPTCAEYADEFRSQEIDGQALMLLRENHLINDMKIKLGPALKICNKIKELTNDG